MSLENDLTNEGNAALQITMDIERAAIKALCGQIIDDTPVLTGALRGSWRSSNGVANLDSTPRLDPSGAEPKEELSDIVAQNDGTEDFVFSNALPYSESIEFDGHSKSHPEGMVRRNLPSWPGLVMKFSSSRGEV